MTSQTSNNYLSNNVQQHIVNKYWSSELGTTGKVVFYFNQNQFYSYINKRKIGSNNHYFTNISCNSSTAIFDNSKVGTSSSGNFIKTPLYCYVIEISTDFQKMRIKKSFDNDTKWQTFYLLNNPVGLN